MIIHKCVLTYFLIDDSITMMEPRQNNSGLNQGCLLRRQRVDDGEGGFITWRNLGVGAEINVRGQRMHIVDCDDYTRKWYEAQGIQQADRLEIPLDPNEYRQLEDQKARQMTAVLKNQRLHAETQHAEQVRRRFLELDRQVLRFYAVWDDRETLFGDRHELTLLYYLVDDTIEVVENRPRAGPSLLIARGPVPRRFRNYTHIEQCRRDGTFLSPEDLSVGAQVSVFGKLLLLYDCDDFTRRFYSTRLGRALAGPISIDEPSLPVPRNPVPPSNGFGTEQVPSLSESSHHSTHPAPGAAPLREGIGPSLHASAPGGGRRCRRFSRRARRRSCVTSTRSPPRSRSAAAWSAECPRRRFRVAAAAVRVARGTAVGRAALCPACAPR